MHHAFMYFLLVFLCVCVCVKLLILGSRLSLSLVVDEWLEGVRSCLRNSGVPRLYSVFTTQTGSSSAAYYWPSKPSTQHHELEELQGGRPPTASCNRAS